MNIVKECRFLLFDLYLTSFIFAYNLSGAEKSILHSKNINVRCFFIKLTDSQNNCRTDWFTNVKL